MKTKLAAVVIVIIVISGAAYYAEARQRDTGLSATGTLEARETAVCVPVVLAALSGNPTINSSKQGTAAQNRPNQAGTVKQIKVRVGDKVKRGDLLLVLDARLAQARISSAQARYDIVKATLEKLAGNRIDLLDKKDELSDTEQSIEDKRTTAQRQYSSNMAKARAKLDEVNKNLAATNTQLQQINLALNRLDTAVSQAQNVLAAANALPDSDPQKAGRVAQAQAALEALEQQHRQSRQVAEKLTQIKAQLQNAKTMLASSLQQGQAKFLQGMRQIDAALAQIGEGHQQIGEGASELAQKIEVLQRQRDQAAVGIRLARRALDATAIRAQQSGVVSELNAAVGTTVFAGQKTMNIVPSDTLQLAVYVPYNRVSAIEVGREAQVSIDGYPDRHFSGRVESIGAKAQYAPSNITTSELELLRVIKVIVTIKNEDAILKAGMPADVIFH